MFNLETGVFFVVALAILATCLFEFINGFHDTANAVTTVIYSGAMKPIPAVLWSGLMNFLGALTGGLGVGLSIIYLIPLDMLLNQTELQIIGMVMAILFSAIIWNFGTWYFGIPASSSHTLIGAIIGVAFGYSLLPETNFKISNINWEATTKIMKGLLLAPVLGFVGSFLVMVAWKYFAPKNQKRILFKEREPDEKPPIWIRVILIASSTMVSFSHGRNDGQKGIGLFMLVLIALIPGYFALAPDVKMADIKPDLIKIEQVLQHVKEPALISSTTFQNAQLHLKDLKEIKENSHEKMKIRALILNLSKEIGAILRKSPSALSKEDRLVLTQSAVMDEAGIRKMIDFAPKWIILMASIALGLGTIFSWKRIVVTIGEKIGKSHLNYAQGASAELVAAATIGFASVFGIPVSTTHTLSSGIAGTMVASKGFDNLQFNTVRKILLTWLLTLPASIGISTVLFLFFRSIVAL